MKRLFPEIVRLLASLADRLARQIRSVRIATTPSVFMLIALLAQGSAMAQTINYTYDNAGRLKSVTNTANETAEYVYDTAGNITQIRRSAANIPLVTEFTPTRGVVGASVTIFGSNFGATPGANTVRFNGVTATVSAASTSQLTAIVPSGATSGPISVQTASGTGTSLQSFTVTGTAGPLAPSIASFLPGVGAAGVAVVITGASFDTAPGMTKVYFNQSIAVVQSVTATAVTALVPQGAGTGRIRVVTRAGTATSIGDFVVAQATGDLIAANYSGTVQRLTLGGGASATMTLPSGQNRWMVIVFEGGTDVPVTVDFTSFTATPPTPPGDPKVDWELHGLRNEVLTSAYYEDTNYKTALHSLKRSIHIPPIPLAGSYALYIKTNGLNATSVNLTAQLHSDIELPADGASAAMATAFQGQSVRYYVRGIAGQDLALAMQGHSQTGASAGALSSGVSVRTSSWEPLRDSLGGWFGFACPVAVPATVACDGVVPRLPLSGVYSVIVTPPYTPNVSTIGGTLWLSNDLQMGVLPFDTDVNIPTLRVGQNARAQFTGSAGARYGLSMSDMSFAPVNVYGPVPTILYSSSGAQIDNGPSGATEANNVRSKEFAPLVASDTYTIFINPSYGAAGTAQLRLWQAVTGTLAINGPSLPVSLSKGQPARFTFTATAGQNLGIAVSGLVITPASGDLRFQIFRQADGVLVANMACSTAAPSRCAHNLPSLVAGTYRVELTPPQNNVRSTSFDLTLSSDIVASLPVNATTALTIPRFGQNARMSFVGTAGQNMRLSLSNVLILNNTWVTISVLRSDGTTLLSGQGVGNSSTTLRVLQLPTLPANDTYTVFVDPNSASTGSMDITLAADATGTLSIDGAPVTINLIPGQVARHTFSVTTAGQNLGIGYSGVSYTPSTDPVPTFRLLNSAGSQLQAVQCGPTNVGGGCMMNARNLAVGTYTVAVDSWNNNAMSLSATLTLSSDVTGALVLNTPYALSVARRGRDALLTFAANAGENRRLTFTGLTTGPSPTNSDVRVTVLRPDGVTAQYSLGGVTTPRVQDLANLPLTGTYYVWFDQSYGLTFSITTTLTQY